MSGLRNSKISYSVWSSNIRKTDRGYASIENQELAKKQILLHSLSRVGNSPSGKAPDSESGIGGSNPSFPTILKSIGL